MFFNDCYFLRSRRNKAGARFRISSPAHTRGVLMEVSLDGIKGHRSFRSRASTLSKLGFGGRICMTPAGSLEGKSGGARGYRVKNNRPFEAFSSDRFNFFFVSKFERCCQNRGSSKKPLCLQLVKTSWLAALLINMTDRG